MFPLLAASFLLLIANGLMATSLAVRISEPALASWTVPVLAAFPAGLLPGSLLAPSLLGRVGHIRGFVACGAVQASCLMAMVAWDHPIVWASSRLLSGLCSAGLYIVLESWLTSLSDRRGRGRVFAAYLITSHVGLVVGQLLIGSDIPYRAGIATVFVIASLLPVVLTPTAQPTISHAATEPLAGIWRNAPLAVIAAFIAGITASAWGYSGGVYIERTVGGALVGPLMGSLFFGGILLQVPIGWLSDRLDRRKVLQLLGLALLLTHVPLLTGDASSFTILLPLIGGVVFSLYPVSLAHVMDMAPSDRVTQYGSALLLTYAVGNILGPGVLGPLMQWDPRLLPATLLGCGLILLLSGLVRLIIRPSLNLESSVHYEPVMSPMTASGQNLDPRGEPEQLEFPFDD